MKHKNNIQKFSMQVLWPAIVLNLIALFYGHSPGYANWPELEQSNYTKSAKVHTPQTEKIKLNGEYGLWVQEINKQIEVHWITAKPDSGFLKVMHQDKLLYEFVTPVSQSHKVTFDKPKGDFVTLQYGSFNNIRDKHETLIYFKEKRPKSSFNKVDSIYVLGDIHGEFDNLVQLLTNANVIDADLNWIANKKHLVALGDLFDRGQDVTKTLWFLYKLEKQADKAGGKVDIVLGNHEIMTFGNDLRYLSAKENLIATMHQTKYAKMFDVHHSVLGKWLASKPGIIKIDDILFAHGGVAPFYANYSIREFNNALNAFLQEEIFQYLLQDTITTVKIDSIQFASRLFFFYSQNSVFWHRGYVQTDTLQDDLKKVLKKFKSNLHVVAHTPVKRISEFYDGKIIAVDLVNPVTEMLLLVKNGNKKYQKYIIKINGELGPLQRKSKFIKAVGVKTGRSQP